MEYKVLNEFIYRIPLLSINKFYSIIDGLKKNYSPLNDEMIQEAIYLASPLLYDEIIKLIDGKITNKKDIERIKYSTIRYLARMSSRCTPFGLFASCNIGRLSESTNLIVDSDIERFIRLDMTYLNTLYDSLVSEEEIRYKIPLYPNSSLYKVFNKYRYIEYKYINNIKKYQISQINSDHNISRILKLAKNGIAGEILINTLCHEGYTNHDSKSYINDLINSKILVYELSQPVTGNDYLTRIIALLQKINANTTTITKLKDIKNSLSIEKNNISFINKYKSIENNVHKLGVNFDKKHLLQVDSIRKNSQITIDEKIIKELNSTISLLDKLTPYEKSESLDLFKSNFIKRYEAKEVSLTEVLDPEFGLGYPININKMDCSPLVDDLILPNNKDSYINTKNIIQELIINKIIDDSNNPCIDEIIIDDSDIKNLNNNIDNLPTTLACFFEIISIKPNLLISLKSIGGTTAANLISRFAYTNTDINKLVKKITDIEQKDDNDSIIAEICYLPENRTGNILFRPHIRDFEILYLSTSDVDIRNQIPVSDLMLSVRNNNFYLRSKKLNRRIIRKPSVNSVL